MKQIFIIFLLAYAVVGFSQSEIKTTMQILEEHSKPPKLDLTYLKQLYKKNELKKAEKEISKLKALYPNHEDLLLFEGKVLMDRDKFDKAMEAFDRVILTNPKNPVAFYYRGLVKDIQKDHLGAVVEFTQSIALKNDFALPYEARATTKSRVGEYFQAIEDYNKALEYNPNLSLAIEGRGLAYYETAQYQKAIKDFKAVLRKNSKSIYSVYHLGMSKLKSGDKSGCKDVRRALILGMNNASVDLDKYCN